MKFTEYLKEDAGTAIVLSQALVIGSIFAGAMGAVADSGGKTINPFTHIRNLYKDWKVTRKLKNLTPDEMQQMKDEIKQGLAKLNPVDKGEVIARAQAVERKLKSDKRDDRMGIADDIAAVQKHIKVSKKIDETKINKTLLAPKLVSDLEKDFEAKIVWDRFILVNGKLYGVVVFETPRPNKGKSHWAVVVKAEKDEKRKAGYILNMPKIDDSFTIAIAKEDNYKKEFSKVVKWADNRLEEIRVLGR